VRGKQLADCHADVGHPNALQHEAVAATLSFFGGVAPHLLLLLLLCCTGLLHSLEAMDKLEATESLVAPRVPGQGSAHRRDGSIGSGTNEHHEGL